MISTHESQVLIEKSVSTYRSRNVVLVIHSRFFMTWGILGAVAKGIWDFVDRYECVEFDFDVGTPGTGLKSLYGTGALTFRSAVLSW